MRLFKQHVNYDDLHWFEASSMVAVAVLAIANGVALAMNLGLNNVVA